MGHVSEHVRDLLAARRFVERLAAHYGLRHLDTGLIYRAVAKSLLDAGHRLDDVAHAVAAAKALDPAVESARESEIAEPKQTAALENDTMVQRENNIAAQDNDTESGDAPSKRRRPQGSALPQ